LTHLPRHVTVVSQAARRGKEKRRPSWGTGNYG
jgi:hypothetical protein